MCGILGLIARSELHCNNETFRDALLRSSHRGPDFSSIKRKENLMFGHNRLSILDLSEHSNQPYEYLERYTMVFNGEIYNYLEIREKLIVQYGIKFKTSGDVEVLIASFHQFGLDCFKMFEGMFAVGIYDSYKGICTFARDRSGEKPLFYFRTNEIFLFGSELKSITPLMDRARVNNRNLAYLLSYGYSDPVGTILEDVHQLAPGGILELDLKTHKLIESNYFDIRKLKFQPGFSELELTDRLEYLLLDSVKKQLRSDVPTGIFLSGGLDSSLVAAAAAKSVSTVRTYSVVFPSDEEFDESRYSKLVADYFGTDHHVIELDAIGFELLPKLAWQFDNPIFDSSMIPTFMLTKAVRQFCTVALGGDGADELFGGYKWYSNLARREEKLRKIPLLAGKIAGAISHSLFPENHSINFWSSVIERSETGLPVKPNFFTPSEINRLVPGLISRNEDNPVLARKEGAGLFAGADIASRFTQFDFSNYMPGDILTKIDRCSMFNSLEVRAPFLSKDLIDFAYTDVPSHLKATPKKRKILLRNLAKKWLPKRFDTARKKGFSVPINKWIIEGQWSNLAKEVLLDNGQTNFNKVEIQKLFSNSNSGSKVFGVLMLELWSKAYGVELNQ